jgi:hypothetical protein
MVIEAATGYFGACGSGGFLRSNESKKRNADPRPRTGVNLLKASLH